MNVTTRPDRIWPRCKQRPLTDEEMGAMWRAGDSIATIANAAKRRNGLTRPQVRAIVMGEGDATTIGAAATRVIERLRCAQ